MRLELIVFNASHYNMDDNKGLSVRILGDEVNTNNQLGISISDAVVSNYNELTKLAAVPSKDYPAKFKADVSFVSQKNRAGKEITGISLKNLEFIESLELVSRKMSK